MERDTIGGDPHLGFNPYYGAPVCELCGRIKSGYYDECTHGNECIPRRSHDDFLITQENAIKIN